MHTTYDVNLYDSRENTTIRICPDGDTGSMVVVKADTDYWGTIDFTMDIVDAEALAKGILKQVQFIKESM